MPSNHLILCLPLSSCLQSFSASGSFRMSQFFPSVGQSIGSSVLPMRKCLLISWLESPSTVILCREPARDIPFVTKVMRKEARHPRWRDRASGVPPDILEYLPPKNQSLPILFLCALTSDFAGDCPPAPSRSLCQRVNLQLQLIKFLGN